MPRLSAVATVGANSANSGSGIATDPKPAASAPKPKPIEKCFHRLYTVEDENNSYEFEHVPQGYTPVRERSAKEKGFNVDGSMIVPDAPKVPGYDPFDQLFRWPDGELRREYPPRNPYVVAVRKRWHELTTHCRMEGGDAECAKGESYRYGIGVLWCAHARYLTTKLNIEPEWNDRQEWYGFDENKQDGLMNDSHPIYKLLRDGGGKSYEDLVRESDARYDKLFNDAWDEARKRDEEGAAYVAPSRLENLRNPGGETPFRCEAIGKESPTGPLTSCTGVDELE